MMAYWIILSSALCFIPTDNQVPTLTGFTSWMDLLGRGQTHADNTVNNRQELGPFGVLNPDGSKTSYLFPGGDRFADRPLFNPRVVRFLLFTRRNPLVPEVHDIFSFHKLLSPGMSSFSRNHPSKIIFPPLNGNPDLIPLKELRSTFVKFTEANVFVVFWVTESLSISYKRVMVRGKKIAAVVARLVDRLPRTQEVHVLGSSLASHLAGFVGKLSKRRVDRITALDASGPIYEFVSPRERLDRTDAIFVDVIHSDMGLPKDGHYGIMKSIGHVDFIVNGGQHQPACGPREKNNPASDICSHWQSVLYYADTVRGVTYAAAPCNNGGAVHTSQTLIPFGEHVPRYARGDYCVIVDSPEDRKPTSDLLAGFLSLFPGGDLRKLVN